MAIPVTLDDALVQLRLDEVDDAQTEEIEGFIADAAAWVEDYTGHILEARDLTERFRVPPRGLTLKSWPIAADAVATVTYSAGTDVPVTVPGTRLDVSRRPARIWPLVGQCWPISSPSTEVQVAVRAGYEDGDEVPRNLRRAMLVLITAYDEDREGGDLFQKAEAAARRMCSNFKRRAL